VIVDTSALVAIFQREPGYETLRDAIFASDGLLPTVVMMEFARVAMHKGVADALANAFIADLVEEDLTPVDFDSAALQASTFASRIYGSGNGDSGPLNFGDLMVYGIAKVRGLPILCTGKDFPATDAKIHPASRPV
jgi:ribonuclease VapC